MIDRYLSIWEIAHRWRNENPDKTDPTNLPLNVQDTVRYICRGALEGELALYEMVVMKPTERNNDNIVRSEVRPYFVSCIPSELENVLYRKYDKEALNAYFVESENLFDYCLESQVVRSTTGNSSVDYPSCWSNLTGYETLTSHDEPDNVELSHVSPLSLRPSQIDKLVCQSIARTLWDEHPQMTIASMAEHKAIQEYGGGKLYTGKNTLRDWLREVAPEANKKPGRPKGSKSNNDAA